MKTIKFSLLAFLFIFATSCSSDDDSPNVDRSMVVGDWNLQAFNYSGSTSGSFEGVDLSTNYDGEAENINAVLSFNEDNTFDFSGSYDIILNAEGTSQVVNMEDVASTGNWRMDGNYIISSAAIGQVQGQGVQGPDEGLMRVSEISENRMVLDVDQESSTTQGGMVFILKTTGRYVLTR